MACMRSCNCGLAIVLVILWEKAKVSRIPPVLHIAMVLANVTALSGPSLIGESGCRAVAATFLIQSLGSGFGWHLRQQGTLD